jgi:hypothetical protein
MRAGQPPAAHERPVRGTQVLDDHLALIGLPKPGVPARDLGIAREVAHPGLTPADDEIATERNLSPRPGAPDDPETLPGHRPRTLTAPRTQRKRRPYPSGTTRVERPATLIVRARDRPLARTTV